MESNIFKNIEKIAQEFNKVNRFSRLIIKHGTQVSLALLFIGTLAVFLYQTLLNVNDYTYFIGTQIIRTSFIILAEAIIGGLLIDYVTKRG